MRELILLVGIIPNKILLKLVIFRHESSPSADNVTKRVFVEDKNTWKAVWTVRVSKT